MDVVGTWELVEWTFRRRAGRTIHPFGRNALGLLTHTGDGRMWAALMRTDRRATGKRSLVAAGVSERAAAAAGYLSYAGTYVVEDGELVHDVEMRLFPDWVGGTQRRLVDWIDGDLVLTTSPEGPRGGINRLRWRRVRRSGSTGDAGEQQIREPVGDVIGREPSARTEP